MSYTRRLWLSFWPAALAVGALTVLIILQSNHDDQRVVTAVLGPLVGWSFIAAGLVAWSRRPANHTGRLMVVINWNTDLGDALEWAESPYYPLKYSTFASEMFLNMIMYSMTR